MFVYFQPNPKGLQTIDCTVRSICAVTGWSWFRAHKTLCDLSRDMGTMPSADAVWWSLLKELGFSKQQLIDQCPQCYTVRDFCYDHPRGVYILGPDQHVVAVINGDYWDSWDSGNTVPTYYFRRD